MDLVSIVLPVYNGEKYLRESIESVLAQTYTNWELIVVDDCSKDSTPQIVEEYSKKDSRIHYYRNENNLRLPRNLNRGFSLTKGQYLTWTSDDNRYKANAIARMVEKLKTEKADFVYCSCRIIDGDGKDVEYINVNQRDTISIIGQNPVGACFMYTRRVYENIGDYNPDLTLVEDWDYWQRIYTAYGAVTITDILYEYRWHDGALTSTMKKDQFNQAKERMLLSNRPLFGTVGPVSNYYYYRGLYLCRESLGDKHNPYKKMYRIYALAYLVMVRLPNKLKRMISK